MFKRNLKKDLIESLKGNELFKQKLLEDIKAGEVFPAIRNNYIDFYHKGQRLFEFKKEFETHIKFASVFDRDIEGFYIKEQDLRNVKPIKSFMEGYDKIKENCALYPGVEASGVSSIYSNYSYAKTNTSSIVVFDIEVSFKATDENKKTDRIDLLLMNRSNNRLRFYEAKHFSNSDLWAKDGKQPKVVKQISDYKEQLQDGKKALVLEEYHRYRRIVNDLFGLDLSSPEDIDSEIGLLIFGFDRDQLSGSLKEMQKKYKNSWDINVYSIGDVSGLNIETMWKKLK